MRGNDRGRRGRLGTRDVVVAAALPLVALAAALGYLGTRPTGTPAPVSEAEARGHLERLVAVALDGDLGGLCALNGAVANCARGLAGARDAVPRTAPSSITARFVDGRDEGRGWVFDLEGVDGKGAAYDSQVMVFRDHEGRLKAINAVWWTGSRVVIRDDGAEGQIEQP